MSPDRSRNGKKDNKYDEGNLFVQEIHNNYLFKAQNDTMDIISECNDVPTCILKSSYQWRRSSRHTQEQMAFDVSKEYKSSIADPARMVAKIESHQLTGNQALTNKQKNVKDFNKKIEQKRSSTASFI